MPFVKLQIVADSDYPAVIRMAALKLMKQEYLDVGSFLKELSHNDLGELVRFSNAIKTKTDTGDMLDSIVLLGEMLSQAEGASLEKPDIRHASNLMILLSFEHLARQGVIEFFRENATLGGDLTESKLVRIL